MAFFFCFQSPRSVHAAASCLIFCLRRSLICKSHSIDTGVSLCAGTRDLIVPKLLYTFGHLCLSKNAEKKNSCKRELSLQRSAKLCRALSARSYLNSPLPPLPLLQPPVCGGSALHLKSARAIARAILGHQLLLHALDPGAVRPAGIGTTLTQRCRACHACLNPVIRDEKRAA